MKQVFNSLNHHYVSEGKALSMVKVFVKKHPEQINAIESTGYTLFHKALLEGYESVARFLYENGADVKMECGVDEMSALECTATDKISPDFFEIIAKNSKGVQRKARLLYRILKQPEKVKIAQQYGFGFDLTFSEGLNILQYLFNPYEFKRREKEIEFLLETNIDINHQDDNGMTAIMHLISLYNGPDKEGLGFSTHTKEDNPLIERLLDKLMKKRPNLTLKNEAGKTVFDIAVNNGAYRLFSTYTDQMSTTEKELFESQALKDVLLNE